VHVHIVQNMEKRMHMTVIGKYVNENIQYNLRLQNMTQKSAQNITGTVSQAIATE